MDVIVVGSGFAGLTAAYVAKKAGANVIVLEKMRTYGGNSIINGGIMGVPGTEIQKEKGIKDSPELMMEDMLKAGLQMNHPDKVRALCEEAYPAYRMLVDELGVEFSKTILKHEGGHSVPRSLFTINGSGSEIVRKLAAGLEKLGVKPRLRTIMDRIVLDDSGRVIGLEVREGWRIDRPESGKRKTIRATKGVILAYGGFGADVAYRSMFDPKLGEKFQTTNQPGATAEGWREAAAIGVQMIQNDWIQCLPYTSPDEPGFGIGWAWALRQRTRRPQDPLRRDHRAQQPRARLPLDRRPQDRGPLREDPPGLAQAHARAQGRLRVSDARGARRGARRAARGPQEDRRGRQ